MPVNTWDLDGVRFEYMKRGLLTMEEADRLLRSERVSPVTVVEGVGFQKPAVTREQYERGREVLDALPSGVYIKCNGCKGWFIDGSFTYKDDNPFGTAVYCERCA